MMKDLLERYSYDCSKYCLEVKQDNNGSVLFYDKTSNEFICQALEIDWLKEVGNKEFLIGIFPNEERYGEMQHIKYNNENKRYEVINQLTYINRENVIITDHYIFLPWKGKSKLYDWKNCYLFPYLCQFSQATDVYNELYFHGIYEVERKGIKDTLHMRINPKTLNVERLFSEMRNQEVPLEKVVTDELDEFNHVKLDFKNEIYKELLIIANSLEEVKKLKNEKINNCLNRQL